VSLVERVAAILDEAGVRYAVIGAAAMAARGVGRSTRDVYHEAKVPADGW
jgi:hypothetical protein